MAALATPVAQKIADSAPLDLENITSVIFLDIDGVLYQRCDYDNSVDEIARKLFPAVIGDRFNNFQSSKAHSHLFHPPAVENLETLVQTVKNVAIVISSDWRQNHTVSQLKEIFANHKFSTFIIDKTPESTDQGYKDFRSEQNLSDRAAEIAYWLHTHPQIKSFVVLDDLEDAFPKNFVHVDRDKLLTKEDIQKAQEILGVKV